MKAKLTTRVIDSLTPSTKMYKVWDEEIKGFFVRVQPTGSKTYCLFYRHNGLGRDYTIGKSGNITATIAREIAKEKSGELAKGNDIQSQKKAAKVKQLIEYLMDQKIEK